MTGGLAGGPLRDPGAEGAAQLLDGQEHRLSPRIRLAWIVTGGLVGLLPATAIAVVVASAGGSSSGSEAGIAFVGMLLAWLLVVVVLASWGFAVWRWTPWEDALEVRHGPIVRRTSLVPYHRIQQIDVHRGPLERMLGLSTLILRTAAATSDARLPGIDAGHTDLLRHALLARAGIDDAV